MKNLKTLYFGILALTLNACYKEIDIELEEGDRKVIVESWFTTEEKVHEIKVTQSTSYFDEEPVQGISGAEVKIIGGGETFVFTETSPGIYHSDSTARAKLKTNYTLSIHYDGTTYSASDYCDTVPNLDYMDLVPAYDDQGELEGHKIFIWTKELSGYGHYYAWRVLINGLYTSDTLSDWAFETDEYLGDGLYFPAWPIEMARDVSSGDVVGLEQHNISKQTYDAWIAVMSETDWRGGIFDSPPANVPTNFNNGALGRFMVSSMVKMEAVVP